MELVGSLNKINDTLIVGERCKFVDVWLLIELGYSKEFLHYANTEWEIIKVTPSWIQSSIKYYFDLRNCDGIVISCIADEVLIVV